MRQLSPCQHHNHRAGTKHCAPQQLQQPQQQLHRCRCRPPACSAAAAAASAGSSGPDPPLTRDTVTQQRFEDAEYATQRQHQRRDAWAAAVRAATGDQHQLAWQPERLDPPLALANVAVVLVGPKKPVSCGTIARALSCFEVPNLRLVQPRCSHNTRSSRSVSKGAQWVLWNANLYDSLTDALSDADLSVAFTRWLPETPNCLPDLRSLLEQPTVQQLLQQPASLQAGAEQQHHHQQQQQRVKLALVFGREEFGLTDVEVAACDLACSIPIGRLQESLSLNHAVTVVLSQLYQARLSATAADPAAASFRVTQPGQLAEGLAEGTGREH